MPQVHLVGEIVRARDMPGHGGGTYTKYKLVTSGENWHLLDGKEEGCTHIDESRGLDENWFGHPIEAHFGTDSMQGWPRLQLETWRVDSTNQVQLIGYGAAFIPPLPGRHRLDCAMWQPRAESWLGQWSSWFLGIGTTLNYTSTVSSSKDRFELRTETCGVVEVDVSVLVKGFNGIAW
eukprot:271449_1